MWSNFRYSDRILQEKLHYVAKISFDSDARLICNLKNKITILLAKIDSRGRYAESKLKYINANKTSAT